MMTILREAMRGVLALVVRGIARLSSRRVGIVLVYHRVGGAVAQDPNLEIDPPISGDALSRQLRHLRRRYRVVLAAQILEATRSRRRGQPFPVAITLDDDLSSHIRYALPALQRAGVPATFFLCGSSLREPQTFWWEALQRVVDDRLLGP